MRSGGPSIARGLGEPAADLGRGWIRQCRPIAEENRRNGEIAVVDPSDERSAIGMIFDVDLVKVDSGAREL